MNRVTQLYHKRTSPTQLYFIFTFLNRPKARGARGEKKLGLVFGRTFMSCCPFLDADKQLGRHPFRAQRAEARCCCCVEISPAKPLFCRVAAPALVAGGGPGGGRAARRLVPMSQGESEREFSREAGGMRPARPSADTSARLPGCPESGAGDGPRCVSGVLPPPPAPALDCRGTKPAGLEPPSAAASAAPPALSDPPPAMMMLRRIACSWSMA